MCKPKRQPARAAHKRGEMNKTEAAYAALLADRQKAGEILDYWFEAVKLNLAPGLSCTYTPDFMVQRSDGVIEMHEVKGYWEDDARVKVKVAASKYPFVFVAVTRPSARAGWRYEQFTKEEQ